MRLMIVVDVKDDGVVCTANHMGMSFPLHDHFIDNLAQAGVHFPAEQKVSAALALTSLKQAANKIGEIQIPVGDDR